MSKALDRLVPLLPTIMLRFSAHALAVVSEDTSINSSLVKNVADVFISDPFFHVISELFRIVGGTIERFAKRLEGCWRHARIWTSRQSWKRKVAELEALTGNVRCAWKGRMGPWWVACGRSEMYAALANCTSALLDQWVALIPAAVSGRLLRILQVCRSRLIEALRSKLEFLSHIPYTLIGVFWSECGGGLEECKELCRQAFAEYDVAVGDGHSLHRVARRLLDKASSCRSELELWVASVGSKLSESPAAFWGLLE